MSHLENSESTLHWYLVRSKPRAEETAHFQLERQGYCALFPRARQAVRSRGRWTERVEALFRKAGVKAGDTVVAYCHVGQQATAVIFGARLLGNPVVLYDGAFQDWAVNSRGPVEK